MNPIYHKLAQIAYDTVLQTMIEGEKTHPDGDGFKQTKEEHLSHAILHLLKEQMGDTSEPHINNALTRLGFIKYLEDERK